MTPIRMSVAILSLAPFLAACEPVPDAPDGAYSPPEASGLVAVRPYPTPLDVCEVIGETEATTEYLDHTATLVGCPESERGAIADRIAEGGTVVDTVGDWVLISIPDS